ncbi:DsbA family protein [Georgenia sp. SUBG003]|uniref:DsbA family protein n=1 Tax=Georgenia sp. SUBG003 TaxID=1497974 RepID=UPI003AB3506C
MLALVVVVGVVLYVIISQGNKSVIASVSDVPANTSVEDGGISLGSEMVAGTENPDAPRARRLPRLRVPPTAPTSRRSTPTTSTLWSPPERPPSSTTPVAILDRSGGEYTGFSGRAVNAVGIVADQAPEAYNAFQTALFTLFAEATAEPTDQDIAATAVEAGVPQEVADTIAAGEYPYKDWVAATTKEFSRDGYTGTPTVLIDGEPFEDWSQPGALADALRN